jgi:SAM-dependent methyltransferase
MSGEYGPATYGDRIADCYDDLYSAPEDGSIDLLVELAGSGPVLELGIGTGRMALPLAARGVRIEGVDASEAMVAKMRSKPGGSGIPVHIGDFSGVPAAGPYSLVFVAFNTFFGLLSREDQTRCFSATSARLQSGGLFLLEVFVPDLSRFSANQTVRAIDVGVDSVALEVSRYDPRTQVVDSQRVLIAGDGVKLYPVKVRYAWPAELDLMAESAGMQLKHRWSGWMREPFGPDSRRHISVYERRR